MAPGAALAFLLWALYPVLVFVGLRYLEPRAVGGLLLLLLVFRRRQAAATVLRDLSRLQQATLAGLALLALGVVAGNSEPLLRLYPVGVSLGMLLLFGVTLRRPPSMVERFARLREPALSAAGVRYTRRVTQLWCAFFVANGAIAAWTAVGASREVWAAYNGFVSYVLMGLLFAGEWIWRRYRMVRRAA